MGDEKKKEEKKKNVLKTANKDYKIEVSGIDEDDRSKYVTELKVEKSAPEPAERKKADEFKKKFEAEPKPEDQKKLEQKKPIFSIFVIRIRRFVLRLVSSMMKISMNKSS